MYPFIINSWSRKLDVYIHINRGLCRIVYQRSSVLCNLQQAILNEVHAYMLNCVRDEFLEETITFLATRVMLAFISVTGSNTQQLEVHLIHAYNSSKPFCPLNLLLLNMHRSKCPTDNQQSKSTKQQFSKALRAALTPCWAGYEPTKRLTTSVKLIIVKQGYYEAMSFHTFVNGYEHSKATLWKSFHANKCTIKPEIYSKLTQALV